MEYATDDDKTSLTCHLVQSSACIILAQWNKSILSVWQHCYLFDVLPTEVFRQTSPRMIYTMYLTMQYSTPHI